MNVNDSQLPLRKKIKGKAGFWLVFPLFFFLLFSCDVEKYGEANVSMDPPLGLTATQVSNTVRLEFWALNNESFFQGYDIRLITNNGVAHSNLSGIAIPNSAGDIGKVAMNDLVPNSTARFFSFTVLGVPRWITLTNIVTNVEVTGSMEFLTNITNEITNFVTNESFASGSDYAFAVRAYTSLYVPYYGEFGNVATLTFTN